MSVSLDEIVKREQYVQFVCVTVIYVIKIVKDVVQVEDINTLVTQANANHDD